MHTIKYAPAKVFQYVNGMATYNVRYVHKISPRATDVMSDVSLPDACFSDRNTLGAALRAAKVMVAGARVQSFCVEGDKTVCFPVCPGLTTYWHSIIITPA